MFNLKNPKRLLVGGVTTLALTGILWGVGQNYSIANAQIPSVAQIPTTFMQEGSGPDGFMAGGFMAEEWDVGYGYISEDELLANALGVTEDELATAYEQALDQAITQLVADGKLTEEEAAQLKGHSEALFFIIEDVLSEEAFNALLAEALGITVEELTAADDTSIDKAVENGLITQAQANDMKLERLIEQSFEDAYKNALEQGVTQGLITQVQADKMLEEANSGFFGAKFMMGPGAFYSGIGKFDGPEFFSPHGFGPSGFGPSGFGPSGFGPGGFAPGFHNEFDGDFDEERDGPQHEDGTEGAEQDSQS